MHQSQNATVAFQKKLWPYPTIILVLLVTSTVILPTQTAAQEIKRLEMSGGYTFLDSSEIVDSFGIGWLAGGAWNTTEWLALGIELNSSAQQQSEGFLNIEASFFSLLAGPRVSMSIGQLRPFVLFLAGKTRVDILASSNFPFPETGNFTETSPVIQIGGGIDIPIDEMFSVRIALDYRRIFASTAINQRRLLTSLVYSFLKH
jgi:hypothetical protein